MSRRTSAQPPAQKPARSAVMATGRPAGESRAKLQRDATRGEPGRRGQAIERLCLRRSDGNRLGIVDRGARTGKRQMCRQCLVQPPGQVPRQQAAQDAVQVQARQIAEARQTGKLRCQPLPRLGRQRIVRQVGPRFGGFDPAHQRHAGLELARLIGPRQRPQPIGGRSAGERRRDLRRVGGFGAVRQDQRPEPAPAPRQDCAGDRIEGSLHLLGHPRRQGGRQGIGIERRRQPDARRGLHLQGGDGEQRRGGERVRARQPRPAAAGETERARLAASLGDPVGKCGRQQPARVAIGARVAGQAQPSAVLGGDAADAGQRATVGGGIAIGDRGEAQADIRRCVGAPQRVALLEQSREVGRKRCLTRRFRRQHHRGEPRMRAQRGHAPAGLGDASLPIERAKFAQQRRRGRKRAGGRTVEECQIARCGAPRRAIQGQRRQFGLEDLRPVERSKPAMQRRRPQADRHARRLAPGPAGPLLGGGARNPQCREPCQAGGGIQPRRTTPPAVNHDAHAGHRQRGLGDRCRQHHPPCLGLAQRAVLLGRRQVAMQRQHERAAARKRRLGPPDLRHARQEAQYVAVMLRQRGANGARHRVRQIARPGDVARRVVDRHRKHPAGALDHLGIHQAGETCPIGGGRHREQTQFRAQNALQARGRKPVPGPTPASARAPRRGSRWRRHPGPDRIAAGGSAGPR